jgi:hypothetical protein
MAEGIRRARRWRRPAGRPRSVTWSARLLLAPARRRFVDGVVTNYIAVLPRCPVNGRRKLRQRRGGQALPVVLLCPPLRGAIFLQLYRNRIFNTPEACSAAPIPTVPGWLKPHEF